jgi:isoquinoline 1-oxidoreductase beta subunit
MQSITEAQYTFPNKLLEATLKNSHVPVTYWRSVGASQNCYFYESFVDEMAHAAGVDPYKFRRASLTNPDWLRVLDLAAEKSGWGQPLPPGKGRGIAIVGDFGSICCQVWDVTVSADGKLKVDRVVVALDPNNVVNPNTIHQQMESGVIYGLTAALYGEITIKDGAAVETNFNRNRMVRMAETPSVIDIYLTPSGGSRWGGVGETGLPPVAPALCNAIFAATGKRIRRLPLKNADLKSV